MQGGGGMAGVSVPTQDDHDALAARVTALERRLFEHEADHQPDPTPQPEPEPAGFWPSGGSPNINSAAASTQFGVWRGRPVDDGDVALCYPTRDRWDTLISATSGQPGLWAGSPITPVVQMPFFPSGSYTYAAAARGEYVPQWRQFATNWKGRRKWISPGWEANHSNLHYWSGPSGRTQNWHAYDEYVDTFDLFAKTVHAIDPDAQIIWTVNGHDSPGFAAGRFPANDPRNILPDVAHLAAIGVDYYDHYPPSTVVPFDQEAAAVNGVRWYMELAAELGVQFAVPEWAVKNNTALQGGGDNPAFITNMHKVFTEAWGRRLPDGRRLLAFECYYDDLPQKMNISSGQNPKSAAEYRRLWAQP